MMIERDLLVRRGNVFQWSPTKDRQQEAEHDADDDAGDDRKIKCGVLALDPNVARQTPKPFRSKSAPKDKADDCKDDTNDDQEFSKLAHAERRLR
jgi:hypothetical protein